MEEILNVLRERSLDAIVYAAMAFVFVIGLAKCVFPVRQAAGRLHRAVRKMERQPVEGERPAWQDSLFLGRPMQTEWGKFLKNAEQLNARGLACNAEDYVNDDTVIYAVGHMPLAEMVPGLLTSLGILGTFIGLMRGLGGLDVSDAARTMESIPKMIGGMTFAFTTSIVGVACSIVFNILSKAALGSAVSAIDDFLEAFNDLVMTRPLDDTVQLICQQEDRERTLEQFSGDLVNRVGETVSRSLERSFVPIAQAMNAFIHGQSQTQMEGLSQITQQFIMQMNRSLSGQLTALGDTLSAVNQSQTVSYDALERATSAAEELIREMGRIQQATEEILNRFGGYVASVETAHANNDAFLTHGSEVLNGLLSASEDHHALLETMRENQENLRAGINRYTEETARALDAVAAEAQKTGKLTDDAAAALRDAGKTLREDCEKFSAELKKLREAVSVSSDSAARKTTGREDG